MKDKTTLAFKDAEGIIYNAVHQKWTVIKELCYRWRNFKYRLHESLTFFKNLKWMFVHIKDFRDYDYASSIDLFAACLERLGKRMLKDNMHVNDIKYGRRALFAAHKLRALQQDYYPEDEFFFDLLDRCNTKRQRDIVIAKYPHGGKEQSKEAFAYIAKHYMQWWT
jgi:hypothetical protein